MNNPQQRKKKLYILNIPRYHLDRPHNLSLIHKNNLRVCEEYFGERCV